MNNNKVYIVTRGSYDSYSIEGIFGTLEAAEKYCAYIYDPYDVATIKEHILQDSNDIPLDKVYKAIRCHVDKRTGEVTYIEKGIFIYTPYSFPIACDGKGIDSMYEIWTIPIETDEDNEENVRDIVKETVGTYRKDIHSDMCKKESCVCVQE